MHVNLNAYIKQTIIMAFTLIGPGNFFNLIQFNP